MYDKTVFWEKCNCLEGCIRKIPEYTNLSKIFVLAGYFAHYAVIGYACMCTTCTLSASATVQVVHTQAHPLNSYGKMVIEGYGK